MDINNYNMTWICRQIYNIQSLKRENKNKYKIVNDGYQ